MNSLGQRTADSGQRKTEAAVRCPLSAVGFFVAAIFAQSLSAQVCVEPRSETAERDLAAVIAYAEPAEQDRLLHDCGDLVSPELVQQLVEMGTILGAKAQFPREERVARVALSLADEMQDPVSRGRALWLLGRARDSQDSYDDALAYYAESRALAAANGDRQTEGRATVGAGFTRFNRFEFPQAREELQRGLAIALSVDDHMIADNAYLAMASMHIIAAEYIDGLRDLDQAREHAEQAGDRAVVAAATANAGLVFMEMNSYPLAVERLREAIDLYHALGNKRGEMRNLRNLAETEAAAQQTGAASRDLDRIDAYLAKEPNDRIAAFAAATRATMAQSEHDLVTADREAQRGLELAAKTENQQLVTVLTNMLSSIRIDQKRYREAAELAEKAVELSRTTSVYPVANEKLAAAYVKLGRTDDAVRALRVAVDAIESELANVPGTEEEQQTFYEDKAGPYYAMFKLLVARHQPEAAIEWVERSRSRSLIEYLGRNKASADRDILSADERREEVSREQEIVALNRGMRELYAQPKRDAAAIERGEKEVRQKRFALQDYEARLFSRHPALALARGAVPRPSVQQIQKLIPSDGAVLQYVSDNDDTWVIVIGHTGHPYIRKIDVGMRALQHRVRTFAASIARRDLGSRAASRKLYDLVVKPAEAVLQSKKSICVIPDGSLWQLPFQALVDGKGQYFTQHKTIFYTPSLSLLAWDAQHPQQSSAKEGLLVVANPRLSEGTVQLAHAVERGEDLGPLPDAEEEARNIRDLYRGQTTVVTGEEATEAFVKNNAGRYRIIHLATHAVFDDTSPLHSHLLLAAGKNSDEDGLLEAREIMNLDLSPDLVILSSCETGRGQVRGGDGLIGMSWALLVAGCPTAVVSQWKVGSAATARLMTEFHTRLSRVPPARRRGAAARALRDAELAVMKIPEYRDPYDWSAFVVIGNGW